ncbi:MAG: hypothetical protein L3J35_02350 [Bacteroidales bacterium]|nr:hypothetical protein [Bacteroidales bacterium]
MLSDINLNKTEIKHILKEVKCISGFDFSEYAHSFIKRITEQFMISNNIFSDVDLIYRINKSEGFVGQFLEAVFVPQTELFRDAEMWNFLQEKIIPKLVSKKEFKIHLPYSKGGEELYSLLYILNKFDSSNIKINVTAVTDKHLKVIKKGEFSPKQTKSSVKNIELLKSAVDSDEIFTETNNKFSVKHNFIGEITFETCEFFKGRYISEFDLILFRNSMIYFNSALKEKSIKTIIRSLKKGAYLIIGEKETTGAESSKKLKRVDKNVSIYKKKSFA